MSGRSARQRPRWCAPPPPGNPHRTLDHVLLSGADRDVHRRHLSFFNDADVDAFAKMKSPPPSECAFSGVAPRSWWGWRDPQKAEIYYTQSMHENTSNRFLNPSRKRSSSDRNTRQDIAGPMNNSLLEPIRDRQGLPVQKSMSAGLAQYWCECSHQVGHLLKNRRPVDFVVDVGAVSDNEPVDCVAKRFFSQPQVRHYSRPRDPKLPHLKN